MSLATRCSDCGTVFRVVQDQLRVSEGWVRCGRCDTVFNALEGLFDLQRETAGGATQTADAAWAGDAGVAEADAKLAEAPGPAELAEFVASVEPVETEETGDAAEAGVPVEAVEAFASSGHDTVEAAPPHDAGAGYGEPLAASIDDEIDAHLFGQRHLPGHRHAPRNVDQRDRLDFSDARFDSDLPADSQLEAPATDAPTLPEADELPLEVAVAPEFLRRAEQRARWRSRPARAALGAAALLLTAGLMLQAAHHLRDPLAARWPQARPLLEAWCAAAGCSLEAPRRIGEISVESTALTRAAGLDAFRLAVMLRSHSALPLALPSVELSLTDANGQLVARRALAPADFRVASTVLPPGAELPLQLLLDAHDSAVTGYTVEIFYP